MEADERIHEYFAAHREEMIDALMALVRIPSISKADEAAPGAPYGEACAEVLRACAALYEKHGYAAENREKYVLATALHPDASRSILLAAHADVVAPGDGWTKCEPFEPALIDGILYGRGVRDDKAGIIASLYAAKCVEALALPFSSKVQLLAGASEETGMDDIFTYRSENALTDLGLVPDSGFPAKRAESARLFFDCIPPAPMTVLVGAALGEQRVNRIIRDAKLFCVDSDALYAALTADPAAGVTISRGDGQITVHAVTSPCPTGEPDTANDALLLALRQLAAAEHADRERCAELARIIETGLSLPDAEGFLEKPVVHASRLNFVDGRAELRMYARYWPLQPVDVVESMLADALEALGYTYRRYSLNDGFYLAEDDVLVTAMLEEYERFTGKAAKSTTGHGGTYSRALRKSVSVGTSVGGPAPELPNGHGGMHQPDECISVDGFVAACELITRMLIRENKILEENLC